MLPEGDLIPVNTSGISYFCFLFLFSFYSFKFEKLDQTKLNSHTEVFYNIGGQPITCRSNVACCINSVKCLFPDTLSFPGMSQIWARNKLWVVEIILIVCPFSEEPSLPSQGSGIQFLYIQNFIPGDQKQDLWYCLQVSPAIWWLCSSWKTGQCQLESKIQNINQHELNTYSIRTCICRIS